MQFAINYSPEAAWLLTAGRIEVDYFKTPPWPDMIAKAQRHRPVSVHFELRAGSGKLKRTDWHAIETFLEQTETRYVNLHLDARTTDFLSLPGKQPGKITAVTERLIEDVQSVVGHFGRDKVIAENSPFRAKTPHGKQPETILPEVIRSVIAETGCGLLLDVSHARISAKSLEVAPRTYMQDLPMDHLRELHFTGIHTLEGGYLQDHLGLLDGDWEWLDWTLEQVDSGRWPAVEMLAFEYGGIGDFFADNTDIDVIAEQVPRLVERVHAADGRPRKA